MPGQRRAAVGEGAPPRLTLDVLIEGYLQDYEVDSSERWIPHGIDAPICQDSRSDGQVCGLARSVVCHHALKDLAGEEAFETADDLPFGPPFSGASFDVGEGW